MEEIGIIIIIHFLLVQHMLLLELFIQQSFIIMLQI